MVTYVDFQKSLSETQPPAQFTPIQKALWFDAKGDWEAAHEIAQSREGTRPFDRLHAYLHRKEGDQWNAGYWYRRANAEVFTGTLEEEWQELVKQTL